MRKNNIKKDIISFIELELNNIDQLLLEISECSGSNRIIRRAKGSILHDFYNSCERIFELIARETNCYISTSEQWHKKLLHRMTIEIKGIRPPVISKELAAELDEYLSFRHLFRNIYGFELESKRLENLIEKFEDTVNLFRKEIKEFIDKL